MPLRSFRFGQRWGVCVFGRVCLTGVHRPGTMKLINARYEEDKVVFHAAMLILNQRMRQFGCEGRVLGERVFADLPNELVAYIFKTYGNVHFLLWATLLCKRMSDFTLLTVRKTGVRERVPKLMNAITTLYTRDLDTYNNLKRRAGRLVRFQKRWSGPYWRVDVCIRPYGKLSNFDDSGDCRIFCVGHAERMHFVRVGITHPLLD